MGCVIVTSFAKIMWRLLVGAPLTAAMRVESFWSIYCTTEKMKHRAAQWQKQYLASSASPAQLTPHLYAYLSEEQLHFLFPQNAILTIYINLTQPHIVLCSVWFPQFSCICSFGWVVSFYFLLSHIAPVWKHYISASKRITRKFLTSGTFLVTALLFHLEITYLI